jgi:hypothetical protein
VKTLWIRAAVILGMWFYMLRNHVDDLYMMFFVGFLLTTFLWLLAKGFPVTSRASRAMDKKEGA